MPYGRDWTSIRKAGMRKETLSLTKVEIFARLLWLEASLTRGVNRMRKRTIMNDDKLNRLRSLPKREGCQKKVSVSLSFHPHPASGG
jgi:hypothetical protein